MGCLHLLGRQSNCGLEATSPPPVSTADMANQSGTLPWSLFLNTQLLEATAIGQSQHAE